MIKNLRKKYSANDIKLWLSRDEVFDWREANPTIGYKQFKQHFFPKAVCIADRADVVGGPGEAWEREFCN